MDRKLYIDGHWCDALGGQTAVIHDPATGEPVGTSSIATAADVDAAVASATKAFPVWSGMHADERAQIMHRAANLIEQRIDQIADLLTREQGKPVPDSKKEIAFGVEVIRYYAEEGRRIYGSLRPAARADIRNIVTSHPLGVVAGIIPWNYPVDLYAWKVAPVLAAGCVLIAKPPHETPLAIGMVVRCFAEAGLPAGVLNDIPGTGPEVGAALSAHPGIHMITATASVPAGQAIMRAAAGNLKRLSLELGGQCPLLVLDDADPVEAAAAAARRSFSNMGQICIAVNRIIVGKTIHRAFVEALVAETAKIKLGHGVEPGVLYGPVLNDSVRVRTRRHLDDAVARGGKLLVGGTIPKGDAFDKGFFYQPAIVDQVPEGALATTEETFGPLAAVQVASDDREAVRIANALPFGLAAYVFSGDLERGWSVAERIEAGAVGVNVNDTSDLQAPFGGWKMSGIGRELGPEGLHSFLEKKHIKLRLRPRCHDPY
ncbi:succinate-semialdehyde dehydrogenase [Agrobacterium rubi TR3 = NBRC 13261]|uniref:Succinate-semialdehyde dehydrogenase n=1 Tax=Agrobacterium rubi TR3 = NBRC 13261 TaxID=1368415 RepID=A0A081D242_9HYPH|nr:aldehyde dehydrogenase family protein [Agrobacterium rubi]MBP1881015.1 acyl-CoA reductase-like NAD-dependent aldehyde dehydrogenase [Agrobacterium rubi]MCL6653744.1 NAD-dependent succinate-semialdehyde dehydrogenase [Agrobacterium rubi]GAK72988.1 succinate-semialdehyde dehydrogenase [Agrobacterium rubi TR3 = NBRC 13261]